MGRNTGPARAFQRSMRGLKTMVAALALAGAMLAAPPAPAQTVDSGHARARLVAAQIAAAPGRTVDVALHLELDRGWHTYWQNPGDSGAPARIEWTLPAGVTAGAIAWPVPERIAAPPFMTHGYHDAVTLPVPLALDAGLAPGAALPIAARAHYLVCREVCLPERADLALTLTVAETARPDPAGARMLAAARAQVPAVLPGLEPAAGRHGEHLYLRWRGPVPREAWFFAADAQHVEYAGDQRLHAGPDGPFLQLPVSTLADGPLDRLRGVLVADPALAGEARAAQVDVALDALTAAPEGVVVAAAAPAPAGAGAASRTGLLVALALAFGGGVLLNLMPCVFPVLAIKAAGLASAAGGRARAAGLAYGAGVLVSVWLLAGALLALRGAGQAIGWGFQLQSAPFVAALALLMVAVGVNLLGAFEMGGVLAARAGGADRHGGLRGALLSGVLAVLLATPCTAPFMAAALGYALAQPAWAALAVFSALGLGLAAPFLVLAEVPGLAARLPRPGAWMVRLRQTLAFPMFATALWLVWVYGRQRDLDAAALLLGAGLALAFALWAWGLAQPRRRAVPVLAALGGVLGAALLLAGALRPAAPAGGIVWQPWSAAAVAQHRAAGRPVFVDYTADWCLTCKVNERLALGDADVARAFAQRNVAALKADWTAYDPAITAALTALGRSGVPVYVWYAPGRDGVLLPELLTPGIVLRALDGAPAS